MLTLTIPAVPIAVAAAVVFVMIFLMFAFYDEGPKYSLIGTVAIFCIALAAYFVTMGVMYTFGGC